MAREWRGVIIQLANLAAIVYLATHVTDNDVAKYALGAIAAAIGMSHARARVDAAAGSSSGGSGGGGALGPLLGAIPTGMSMPPSSAAAPPRAPRMIEQIARELVFAAAIAAVTFGLLVAFGVGR